MVEKTAASMVALTVDPWGDMLDANKAASMDSTTVEMSANRLGENWAVR